MLNKKIFIVLTLAIVIALFLVPVITTNTYYHYVLIMIFLNAILALSLRLIMNTGEISFAHAAFMAVGAYASAILVTRAGFSVWAAFPVASLITAALAVVVGIPALRVKGVYFFLVSFSFGMVVILIIKSWPGFLGGTWGIPDVPQPGGITTTGSFYFLALGLTALTLLVLYLLDRSRFGIALKAIKGISGRGYATDNSFLLELRHPRQRQDDVDILKDIFRVDVEVIYLNIALDRSFRNRPIGAVTPGGFSLLTLHIERGIALQTDASAGNQGKGGLIQWL